MALINIAQGTPCAGADGSVHNPYRARPDNATDFDDIFRLRRGANTFLVQPGIYLTQGCYAYPQNGWAMIDPNSSLIGVGGSEATSIVLAANYISINPQSGQPIKQVETIIGGGSAASGSERMQVSGFRIDVNNSLLPVLGLHTFSSGSNVFDVIVVGLIGDRTKPLPTDVAWEGFGILVNDSPSSRGGGSSIANCRAYMRTGSPKTYVTGIYLGSVAVQKNPNVIRDCYCEAPIPTTTLPPNDAQFHAAFAANQNTLIQNCTSNGFIRFFYADTGDVGDIEITGCRGDVGQYVVDAIAPYDAAANPIAYRRRIRLTNSTFTIDHPVTTYAVIFHAQEKNTEPAYNQVVIEDIDIHDLRVRSSLPAGNPALQDGIGVYTVGLQGKKVDRVFVRNCTLPVGTKTTAGVYDTDYVPPATSGTPLPAGRVVFENLKFTPVVVTAP